ncbi:MAG: hypothetical protein ABI469_02625 [Gemmatimonadales bacterium]
MKVFSIALALTALATSVPVGAQIMSTRVPTTTRSTVDGSWYVVGRDASGNTIYERQTRDRNGNIVVQRARRNSNGSMSIISSRTVASSNSRNSRNCDYTQSTNTVGDIIFGRNSSNVNCDDRDNRVDGGWYQVGQGRDNNSIYERRVRDSNGNLVIQRARRNSDGSFRILSTRRYDDNNDKQWKKAQKQQQKEWKKEQKEQDKEWKNNGKQNGKQNGKHKGNQDRD